MKRRIKEVKKIVIKVGSSSLCDKDGKINKEKILMLTWQIAKLKREGYIVVLVSSGACRQCGRGSSRKLRYI